MIFLVQVMITDQAVFMWFIVLFAAIIAALPNYCRQNMHSVVVYSNFMYAVYAGKSN